MDIIIGIDPGATSGWAALTVELNPNLILSSSIKWPKPGAKTDLSANTPSAVAEAIVTTLGRSGHTVIGAAIEDQYLSINPDSMKKLARNAGRWEEAWRRLDIPVAWINTQTWQSAELGTSRIKSAEVKRRCEAKARGLWKKTIAKHEADAAIIGRYFAVQVAYRAMRMPKKGKVSK